MDNKSDKLAIAALFFGALAMYEEPTTVIIQCYLDALPGNTAAEQGHPRSGSASCWNRRSAACACCAPRSCTRATRG